MSANDRPRQQSVPSAPGPTSGRGVAALDSKEHGLRAGDVWSSTDPGPLTFTGVFSGSRHFIQKAACMVSIIKRAWGGSWRSRLGCEELEVHDSHSWVRTLTSLILSPTLGPGCLSKGTWLM